MPAAWRLLPPPSSGPYAVLDGEVYWPRCGGDTADGDATLAGWGDSPVAMEHVESVAVLTARWHRRMASSPVWRLENDPHEPCDADYSLDAVLRAVEIVHARDDHRPHRMSVATSIPGLPANCFIDTARGTWWPLVPRHDDDDSGIAVELGGRRLIAAGPAHPTSEIARDWGTAIGAAFGTTNGEVPPSGPAAATLAAAQGQLSRRGWCDLQGFLFQPGPPPLLGYFLGPHRSLALRRSVPSHHTVVACSLTAQARMALLLVRVRGRYTEYPIPICTGRHLAAPDPHDGLVSVAEWVRAVARRVIANRGAIHEGQLDADCHAR